MSKVFVNIALSLDGYMAPEGMNMANWDKPDTRTGAAKWGALMGWILNLQYFRENAQAWTWRRDRPGQRHAFEHLRSAPVPTSWESVCLTKASVAWPEEAPFHTPVYVLTHEKRDPWVRPGGTTFHFINEGPERALALAQEAAGSRDIRIAGGADVIQQYLTLGVVDELEIALAPVIFGGGRRLFENLREPGPQFRIDKVLDGPAATHLRYVRQ